MSTVNGDIFLAVKSINLIVLGDPTNIRFGVVSCLLAMSNQ